MSRHATLVLGIALTAAATAAIAQDLIWNDLRKAATALYMKRDLNGAIALEKKALAIAEKDSPRDPRILKDLGAMGSLYSLQHRYDDAIPVYERAVALNDAGVADPRLKSTLNDLAAAYRAVGRAAEAKKAQARAAAL